MNAELIAHGYSNALSGVLGGLQNYMTYSNSVLYAKTGGKGLISSLAIVVFTMGLFVVGPSICDFLPRCLAGTLLLHIGVDLFLEGVYDSIGQYDVSVEAAGSRCQFIFVTGCVLSDTTSSHTATTGCEFPLPLSRIWNMPVYGSSPSS
jgi:MFS superfamily sulfate permease-like transporter